MHFDLAGNEARCVNASDQRATQSNAIFNASARLNGPATYPQTPRSEACLRRPRLAATSCLRSRHDGWSKTSATETWWLRQRAGWPPRIQRSSEASWETSVDSVRAIICPIFIYLEPRRTN